MRLSNVVVATGSAVAILLGMQAESFAQMPPSSLTLNDIVVQTGPASEARGAAPVPPVPNEIVGANLKGIPGGPGPAILDGRGVVAAQNGDAPAGIEPLERDIFNSDDFYADKDLWMDPRYYRCNSPKGLEGIWGAYEGPLMGDDPPRTAAWGYCDRDYERADMVSPYKFKTAQEHYEALMAEAVSRGGPTKYSRDNPPPDWEGAYSNFGFTTYRTNFSWAGGELTQVPTYLSLLTPLYQQRFVQQMYHYAASNAAVWPGAYCWPEGFSRRFWATGGTWIMVGSEVVQMAASISETLMTQIHIGAEFKMDGAVPNLLGNVPQWYGDTIGFWDGDILITWTSNVKSWMAHGTFEFSGQMQSIEIYSPVTDKAGKFVGISREAILYDPEALVEPVRIIQGWERLGGLNERPFGWRECVQTLFPVDGRQMPVVPGATIEYTVPDLNGRPWADIWVNNFEQNMTPPAEADVLAGF